MGVSRVNALSLLTAGLVLRSLPDLHAGWFPPDGWDGTNAQAIWLSTMGTITGLFGAYYLVKTVMVPFFWRWASVRPAKVEAPAEAFPPPAKVEQSTAVAVASAAVPASEQRMVA